MRQRIVAVIAEQEGRYAYIPVPEGWKQGDLLPPFGPNEQWFDTMKEALDFARSGAEPTPDQGLKADVDP